MRSEGLLRHGISLLFSLLWSCARGEARADALVMPEGLAVRALEGGNGVLEVTALTLQRGPQDVELYAALHNVGAVPACHAAFAVELFDIAGQSLAAGITGLLSQHFYRVLDGSDALATCVAPGERTVAAVLDLTVDGLIEDVGTVVYRTPYFALEVESIAGVSLEDVKRVSSAGRTTYTGHFVNRLARAIDEPLVAVFPLQRSGRPLGMTMSRGTDTVAPGATWAFETQVVDTLGSEYIALPAGALRP